MKWEYKTVGINVPHKHLGQNELNELGQDGWELEAIADTFRIDSQGDPMYLGIAYFKRPANEEVECTMVGRVFNTSTGEFLPDDEQKPLTAAYCPICGQPIKKVIGGYTHKEFNDVVDKAHREYRRRL